MGCTDTPQGQAGRSTGWVDESATGSANLWSKAVVPPLDPLPLAQRGALVTGVSRRAGIGHAIAGRLLDLGASVFVQGWTPHDKSQPWGADDGELGLGVAGRLEADFADPGAPEAVLAAAADALGHVEHPRRQPRAQRARQARRADRGA